MAGQRGVRELLIARPAPPPGGEQTAGSRPPEISRTRQLGAPHKDPSVRARSKPEAADSHAQPAQDNQVPGNRFASMLAEISYAHTMASSSPFR